MPKSPIAPLLVANEKEKNKKWDQLETPQKLANWFQKVFAVDLEILQEQYNLYISPDEPKGGNRGKVHVKTSSPIGIGFPVQGKYQYIYQYPPNTPLQVPNTIPSGLTALSTDELTSYDLSNGTSYKWAWLKI